MAKLPFSPGVFFKVAGVVLVLLVLGLWILNKVVGELTITDMVGAVSSAVILAYLVHLWLLPGEPADQDPPSQGDSSGPDPADEP